MSNALELGVTPRCKLSFSAAEVGMGKYENKYGGKSK